MNNSPVLTNLLQEIGAGGFGMVWMAEQMEPVSRRVALKIIKLGMDTGEVIARFEAERQALAMMDHPHIRLHCDGVGAMSLAMSLKPTRVRLLLDLGRVMK